MSGMEWRSIFKRKFIFRTEFIFIIKYIHDIINPKYLKKEGVKNFKFPQEWKKDKSFQALSSAIHQEEWGRHFGHEYIIKLLWRFKRILKN